MKRFLCVFLTCTIVFVSVLHYASANNNNLNASRLQNCIRIVNEINSLILSKTYLCWEHQRGWWLSIDNDSMLKTGSDRILDEFAIFTDADNRIRKIIYTNYEYEYDVRVFYYDTTGTLIHSIFYLGDIESAWSGYQYSDKQGIIVSNLKNTDLESGQGSVIYKAYSGKVLNIGDWKLDSFLNTDKFKSYYNIDQIPENCKKVTFSYDVQYGKTIINCNDVRVRSAEGIGAEIITDIDAGGDITIISQGKQESISPWGQHFWYKVKYNRFFYTEDQIGYVFGAFLEPVEKTID